ncbi:PTS transporter subunit EIIC [Marinilactibacillus sp. GCM10026970]|uniref:PTS transporter subunit EIIC n=1 Tax=Marinilactibacillus sp. GCM10026970 TaxID=3252642 RepID=UPI003622608C
MDYKKMAQNIIDISGGKENFSSVINCMTRVRIKYHDRSKVDKESIEQIPGVLGIKEAETFQIIVGPGKSTKLQEAINEELGMESSDVAGSVTGGDGEKQNFLKILASIFVPIIPAIIASGILQGLNNVLISIATNRAAEIGAQPTEALTSVQVVLSQWNMLEVSTILGILGQAAFGFLAIYIGITSARIFKADMIMGGLIGAMTLSTALPLIGLTPGQGGLFGVILGVWIFSKIDRALEKFIPDLITVVVKPTLSLLITGVIFFFIIMPITGILTDGITDGIIYLIENTGIFGGFVLAAISPVIISTGLHHGLLPVNIEIINATGSTPINAVQIMSNAGLVGAGLGLYFLTKRPIIKETARGVLPTTFLAVGEPTMFGLVIPSGFGFITASLGAGFGGAMIRLFDVQMSALGAAGMSAIPLIADGKYLQYLISYAVGLVAAFGLTMVAGKFFKYE